MDLGTAILVGAIQGVIEWLPMDSEGMVALALVKLLGKELNEAVFIALGLHVGTLFAAIVYFRRQLRHLFHALFRERADQADKPERPIAIFLLLATLITVLIGGPLVWFGLDALAFSGASAMALVGALLIITGIVQEAARHHRVKPHARVNILDAFLLGIVQSLALLPGLSRSGLTTSALLLRRYEGKAALELSFLLSIPIVAVGIVMLLLTGKFVFDLAMLVAAVTAFVVGLLTVSWLLRLVSMVRFGWLCIVIGLIAMSPLLI